MSCAVRANPGYTMRVLCHPDCSSTPPYAFASAESWKLFDGLLTDMAENQVQPLIYKRGTRGPAAADERLQALGVRRTHAYTGPAWKKLRSTPAKAESPAAPSSDCDDTSTCGGLEEGNPT